MDIKIVTSMSELYGKELIAYGLGEFGKDAIPALAQTPQVHLLGVTSSRITEDDAGTFQGTGLRVRSVESWVRRHPGAAILVTVIVVESMREICVECAKAGFQEVFCLSPCMALKLPTSHRERGRLMACMCYANEIRDTHKASFSEFRACHRGQTVAVVASGPTLNHYTQISGVPHIGVNETIYKSGLDLDYYFLYHYVPEWLEVLKQKKCTKFFVPGELPDFAFEENNARTIFLNQHGAGIPKNIEYYPLMMFGSIIFPAIHFALYTRPKRIMLIGCDCTSDGRFDKTSNRGAYDPDFSQMWIEGYEEVKKFVARYYPDTEIISVNPVGLKGMFRDVYTESYLSAHPDINSDGCQILNPDNANQELDIGTQRVLKF